MTALALALLAIGFGDATHGLAGAPATRRRAWTAVGVTGVVAVVAAPLAGVDAGGTALVVVGTTVIGAAWQLTRVVGTRAQVHLAVLGAGLVAAALVSSAPIDGGGGPWRDLVDGSRVSLVRDSPPDRVLYVLAAGVFMVATANAVVRVVLDVTIDGEPPTTRIRGGRVIGPLERLLVVGFVVAGQPTTAALVVTAKSLLRYPELRTHDDLDVHAVTEYVLIGSLTSWSLALLVTVPLL